MFKKIKSLSLKLSSQVAEACCYTLEISTQELQDKISALMPLEKQQRYYHLIISDPEVELISETNEIGLYTQLNVVILGKIKATGHTKIKGSLNYIADDSAFYLRDPQIISLTIDKVGKRYQSAIKAITQKVLTRLLAKKPVYKFQDDNIKHKLAKSVLKSIKVKNQHLLITLSTF